MRNDKRKSRQVAPVLVLAGALALAGATLADARHPGGLGGPGGPGHRPGGPPPIDDPCAMECIDENRGCMDAVRELVDECTAAAGCEVAREDLRAICGNGNHESEECRAARDTIRECVGPCHEASRSDAEACREDNRSCLEELCGIDVDERPARPGRFQRPDQPSLGS